MKIRHFIYMLFISFYCIIGCKESNDKEKENKGEEPINKEQSDLLIQLTELKDSIEALQSRAFALEDEKINSTTALIDEVENVVVGYNPSTLATIRQQLDTLKLKKYTTENLNVESVMLAYDEACDKLVSSLQMLAENIEEFEKYNRANLLISDILMANNQDFFIRKDYNNYVLEYNNLLEAKRSELENIASPDIPLEKYPLFYGELES